MPEIDLEPHEFAERDKRTGKLKRQMSPRWCRNWMIVALAMLGVAWWNRVAIGPDVEFWYVAMFGTVAGIMFGGWLKDVY